MADALHETYQLPYEDIAKIQIGGRPGSEINAYLQKTPEGKTLNHDELNVTHIPYDGFGAYSDIKELRERAVQFFTDNLQGKSVRNEMLGKIVFDKDPDIYFSGTGKRK